MQITNTERETLIDALTARAEDCEYHAAHYVPQPYTEPEDGHFPPRDFFVNQARNCRLMVRKIEATT